MALNPLLLQALASGDSETSPQDLLLSQLDSQDPTVAMLAKYLTQSSDTEDEDDETDLDDDLAVHTDLDDEAFELEAARHVEALEAAEARLSDMTDIAHRLRQKLVDIYTELEELRERSDSLAEALGACGVCWGEDRHCQVCGGRGQPGAFLPDLDMFRHYVVPATQRLQQQHPASPPR